MEIGSRLELFVDHYLIEEMKGLELVLHSPKLAAPSPSPVKGYYMTIIEDGGLYRAYYRDYLAGYQGPYSNGSPGEITCYAESNDGRTWQHPQSELYGAAGPLGRNVILAGAAPSSHNFSPFVDARPGVPAAERYKALGGVRLNGKDGLFAYLSRDGLNWTKMAKTAVIDQTVALLIPKMLPYLYCHTDPLDPGTGGIRPTSCS